MLNRLIGIVTLKAPVYKEVAEDQSALVPAAVIVLVSAVVSSLVGIVILSLFGALPAFNVLLIVKAVINSFVQWLLGSVVLALVAKYLFKGDTNVQEMLRVTGFVQIFSLLTIVPVIGAIAALILMAIGYIIAIREAASFSTGNAVLSAVIAIIVTVVINNYVISPLFG